MFLSAVTERTLAARRPGMIDAASDEIARMALVSPDALATTAGLECWGFKDEPRIFSSLRDPFRPFDPSYILGG